MLQVPSTVYNIPLEVYETYMHKNLDYGGYIIAASFGHGWYGFTDTYRTLGKDRYRFSFYSAYSTAVNI